MDATIEVVVVFAMAAGNGDAVLESHQLGKHFAARDDRDLQTPRFGDFRIRGIEGRGNDNRLCSFHVLCPVSDLNVAPSWASRSVVALC